MIFKKEDFQVIRYVLVDIIIQTFEIITDTNAVLKLF